MGNEPTNQDEMKIKRGEVDRERQLPLMNNICPRHSLNQITLPLPPALYLRATSHFLSPSLWFFSLCLSFFFLLLLSPPLLLCDCWSPKRDRGMLQECESNRCLITVLIAGRGETRAFSQWRATAEMITPPHSSHSRAPFSRHFMAELPGMNNSNVSTPRARVYLETRAHTTATNSQISHLTPVQDLLESWSCKLWKGVFFLLPPTFFFFLGGGGSTQTPLLFYDHVGRDHRVRMGCTDNWQHVETITWSPFFSTWILFAVHTRIQRAHYSLSLFLSLVLCSSNDLSLLGCTLSFLSLSPHTQLHQQSSTLKRIPMRHVTCSLCPAVCLLREIPAA